jgi:hypothetical protein
MSHFARRRLLDRLAPHEGELLHSCAKKFVLACMRLVKIGEAGEGHGVWWIRMLAQAVFAARLCNRRFQGRSSAIHLVRLGAKQAFAAT